MEPIGVRGDTGPDNALVDGPVGLLEEDTLVDAAVEGRVVLVGDCGVDHDDVVLVVAVEVVDDFAHAGDGEALGV